MKNIEPFDFKSRDERRWKLVEELLEENNFDIEYVLKNFPAFIRRRELPRFLAHYELFKKVIDLPGCIVELGVSGGVSLMTWTHLMETFCPCDRTRMVFGFDNFEGLQDFSEQDGAVEENSRVGKHLGGWKSPGKLAKTLVKLANEDSIPPGIERVKIIEGDIFDTLPKFLKENPGLKIALLHLDVDLYNVTKFAFDQLYNLVCTGGVVCLDEYGLIPWQGETKAVDEFFDKNKEKPIIKKFPFSATPSGYFVKQD